MTRFVCAIFLLGAAAGAAPADACSIVPLDQVAALLGITRSAPIKSIQLPSGAVEGKACSYGGQENAALVIRFRFQSPAAAREELERVRAGLEKRSVKTVSEKFDGEDGFSFASGMLAVKKNVLLRVKVGPPMTAGSKADNPGLTRQLLLIALKAN